jgi:phosphate uptake regulator
MNKPILRKLQLTGGSTYIVSLPKNWIRALGLGVGDVVEIHQDKEMRLIIVPRKLGGKGEELIAAIECKDSEPEYIIREMIAYYMAGYSTVSINCIKIRTEDLVIIKDFIRRRLLGAEVVDETANSLIIQFLVSEKELSISKALSRISHLAFNMIMDALSSLKDYNIELAKQVVQRDDEVDRLYFYITRQLTMALTFTNNIEMNELNYYQIPDLHLVARFIERVADHSVRMSYLVEGIKLNKDSIELIVNYGIKIANLFKKAVVAFLSKRKELAYEVLKDNKILQEYEDITNKLLDKGGDINSLSKSLLYLDSLRRVNRYSFDIAEVTINMIAKETLK